MGETSDYIGHRIHFNRIPITHRCATVQVKQPTCKRQQEERCCLWSNMQGLWGCIQYIGETSRPFENRLSEHQNMTKKHDTNNEIAAHTWTNQHQVDWKAAKTRRIEGNCWKIIVLEALHIHQQQNTSNLGCGLAINPSWLQLLNNSCMLLTIYYVIPSLYLCVMWKKNRWISLQTNCSDYFIFLFQVDSSFTFYVSWSSFTCYIDCHAFIEPHVVVIGASLYQPTWAHNSTFGWAHSWSFPEWPWTW